MDRSAEMSRMAGLWSRGRTREAVEFARQRLACDPDIFWKMQLAFALRIHRDFDAARKLLEAVPEHERSAGGLQYIMELGQAYEGSGRDDDASTLFQTAAKQYPASHWPVLAAARLLHKRARTDDALALIARGFPNLHPEGRAEAARCSAEMQAQLHFKRARISPDWCVAAAAPVEAFARCVIFILTKDEDDILGAQLRHHHALGFRNFCIVDNASTDSTAAVVQAFRAAHPEAMVFYAYDSIRGHYQAEKMRLFQLFAERYWALAGQALDWAFFLDTDEFLTHVGAEASGPPIAAILADPVKRLLAFHWVTCASTTAYERTPRRIPPHQAFPVAQAELGEVATKVAFRPGDDFEVLQGNHFVPRLTAPLEAVVPMALSGWYLFHFPLRSVVQVKTKVINGGLAFQDAKGLENHGGHWKQRYEQYQQHGDTAIRAMLASHVRELLEQNRRAVDAGRQTGSIPAP